MWQGCANICEAVPSTLKMGFHPRLLSLTKLVTCKSLNSLFFYFFFIVVGQ